MKTLCILRHAKSSWSDPDVSDHDRELNRRGLRDAPRIGRELAAHGIAPDAVFSSTATRARHTAGLVLDALALDPGLCTLHEDLYLASARG
ncbi:MAG: histidine phosphatase family protein, partial [Pseudomonadota bacterium]